MPADNAAIRTTLSDYLSGAHAHAGLGDAVKDFPAALYGKKPDGAPHTAWQLLEHIRLALHDLVEFSTNPDYRPLKWPQDYWPKKDAPASAKEWNDAVHAVEKDMRAMQALVQDAKVDLTAKIPWGDGQTVLHEVLLAIDHTSYHLGQLVTLRQELGAWKK